MDIRRVALIVGALVIAGVTAFFARNLLNSERASATRVAQQENASQAPAALQVLVARNDIRTGQIVKPDDLRWQIWPEGTLSPTYVVEGRRPLSDFVGAVARGTVSAGEPITEGRVVLPGARGFMAAVLSPGMRAVSVPVTATSGIAGFVFAGDRVDLLLTHIVVQATQDSHARQGTETILRDIRIIAMDQKLDAKPGDAPKVAQTATLEVTPKQGEIIALAQEMGKLSLSLRALQDGADDDSQQAVASAPDSGTRDTEVSKMLAPPAPPRSQQEPQATAGPAPAPLVTIIRGRSEK